MTKTCTRCDQTKDIELFNWKNKKEGRRGSWCKKCVSEARLEIYHRDPEKQRVYERGRRKECLERFLNVLKQSVCIDCGEDDPVVLQFDHVRGKKKVEVTVMVQHGYGWATIENEMQKCEVRCANCHVRRTAAENGWFRGA